MLLVLLYCPPLLSIIEHPQPSPSSIILKHNLLIFPPPDLRLWNEVVALGVKAVRAHHQLSPGHGYHWGVALESN